MSKLSYLEKLLDGASAGFINFVTSKFYANAHCYVVLPRTDIVQNRYVYHFLKLNQEKLTNKQHGAGIPALRTSEILDIPIPIPCPENQKKSLAIQTEIVRILDAFTQLAARKKQYDYYRQQLLTFEDGEVEWKPLEDVCSSISAGGDLPENYAKGQIQPSDEFPYPIYANATGEKGLYGFTDGYKIENDAVTISARGAKIGYHTVREGKFTPIIRLITLVPNKSVTSTRYLNYILDMTSIGGTDGGIPQLTVPTVKKISVPIPSLAKQNRIVNILNKFDTLTTSLSEGLPHEIELRQKQYEYYRDLLLNFPKPEEKQHG
jgi:type I restriction enzyme S subunit